jgi:hypothetical protein
MRDEDTAVDRWTAGIGTAIFVSWLLFLGPVGILLLLSVAYAMLVQNLALGIIGGLLLATPLILSATWVPVAFYAVLRERRASVTTPALNAAVEAVKAK